MEATPDTNAFYYWAIALEISICITIFGAGLTAKSIYNFVIERLGELLIGLVVLYFVAFIVYFVSDHHVFAYSTLVVHAAFLFGVYKLLSRLEPWVSMEDQANKITQLGHDTGIGVSVTGIPWMFDKVLWGGLPKGRVTLIVGPEGAGKTLFGLEFLYNGAKFFNEKGLFLSPELREEIKNNVETLGWELDKHREKLIIDKFPLTYRYRVPLFGKKLRIKGTLLEPERVLRFLQKALQDSNDPGHEFSRVVIDGLPAIIGDTDEPHIRRFYQMLNLMAIEYKVACVVISDTRNGDYWWQSEPYVVDSIIRLRKRKTEDLRICRTLTVEKHRGMPVPPKEYHYEIRDQENFKGRLRTVFYKKPKYYRGEEAPETEIIKPDSQPGIWVQDTSFETSRGHNGLD